MDDFIKWSDDQSFSFDSRGKTISVHQQQDKGWPKYLNGMEDLPGFFIDCDDGNTYLVFAPDMESVTHMHCYERLTGKIRLAMGGYSVLRAPITELGKVYVVDKME